MDVESKMKHDIDLMKQQINAKIGILQEVFCHLTEMESSQCRQTVREVFQTNPTTNKYQAKYLKSTFLWSIGLDDMVAVAISIENLQTTWEMLPSCHIANVSAKWKYRLFDELGRPKPTLKPESSGLLLIGLPKSIFFKNKTIHVIIDSRWTPKSGTFSTISPQISSLVCKEFPSVESLAVEVEEPPVWKKMSAFLDCSEHEAQQLEQCLSVCYFEGQIREKPTFEFRHRFPLFDCSDFGEWQMFVGTGKYQGILVRTSPDDAGTVSQVYSSSDTLLKCFMEELNGP